MKSSQIRGGRYRDRQFRSLSAIARELTGVRWNAPRLLAYVKVTLMELEPSLRCRIGDGLKGCNAQPGVVLTGCEFYMNDRRPDGEGRRPQMTGTIFTARLIWRRSIPTARRPV